MGQSQFKTSSHTVSYQGDQKRYGLLSWCQGKRRTNMSGVVEFKDVALPKTKEEKLSAVKEPKVKETKKHPLLSNVWETTELPWATRSFGGFECPHCHGVNRHSPDYNGRLEGSRRCDRCGGEYEI